VLCDDFAPQGAQVIVSFTSLTHPNQHVAALCDDFAPQGARGVCFFTSLTHTNQHVAALFDDFAPQGAQVCFVNPAYFLHQRASIFFL